MMVTIRSTFLVLIAMFYLVACQSEDPAPADEPELVEESPIPNAPVIAESPSGKPGFMSAAHVEIMNALLSADEDTRAESAKLDKTYVMAYELANGPQGNTVWWQMQFDPESGIQFSLEEPGGTPDLLLKGDYPANIRAMKLMAAGEQVDMPLESIGDASLMETIGAAFAAGQKAATIETVFPEVDTVVLETERGLFEVTLYPNKAPISAANFLAYVVGGHFDDSTIYRSARHGEDGSGIDIVQGGLLAETYARALVHGNIENVKLDTVLPPIAHETTDQTGMINERGVIAWGRLAPGTAASEYFINLGDNPGLDTGDTSRNPDGMGYATFGRVTAGMEVLEQIQGLPTGEGALSQVLIEPVKVIRAYRKLDGPLKD